MTDAPERIWAYAGTFKMWRDHKTDAPHTQTEYRLASLPATDAQALANPKVQALVELVKQAQNIVDPCSPATHAKWQDQARAAIAALENPYG